MICSGLILVMSITAVLYMLVILMIHRIKDRGGGAVSLCALVRLLRLLLVRVEAYRMVWERPRISL